MKSTAILVTSVLLALGAAHAAPATSILFIGNSFTFGAGSPVHFYRADTVTDLNKEGIGGVPALFKSFATPGRPRLRRVARDASGRRVRLASPEQA